MSERGHAPAYTIHTNRLVIRCWQPQDAPLLQTAIIESLDHLRPWMPWVHSEPEDLQTKIERLRHFRGLFDLGQNFLYGVFDAQGQSVVGGTGLHTRAGEGAREIGYWIHQDYLNQGFATEVSAALVKVAFEIEHVDRVEIHCNPENVRSAAVPRKLGFTHEATLRRRIPFLDEPRRDDMVWTLLADEYATSSAARITVAAFDVLGRQII